jgi:hypothetical protein
MKALQDQRDYIGEFRGLFAAGVESLVKACEVYVIAIDEKPGRVFDFQEEFKEIIPAGAWSQFEAVGRKWMHPKLLLGGGGRYAGKIKRLPYSTQEQIFSGERFELITPKGEALKVDVREIQPEQAEQLFDGGHLRTPSEQRAWIEARCNVVTEKATPMPYKITDHRVTFTRGTVLTKREVTRILAEM